MEDERATLTIDQTAKLLGISRGSVYEGVRAGRIPSLRISPRRIVVPRAALDALLKSVTCARTAAKSTKASRTPE